MREIKFRAWDKKRKEMLRITMMDFAEWWVSCRPPGTLADPLKYGERNSFKNEETDRHILMQHTGLKDKNGVEIYEGDVFKFHPSKEWEGTEPANPCVVFWSDELCAFMFYVGKPEMSTLLPPSDSIEVIGNIYENPGLLSNVVGK